MNSFDSAFEKVCRLVDDFKENESHYLSPKYNEQQARKDYIDRLFIALGWDVNHTEQRNPYRQEVKVEETQINQRRPDYTFYIEPKFKEPKFFVEAKKPSRNLKDPMFYYQTIRYARFSSTPVAVLTDFEEFHILDCRFKPDINTVLKNPNHLCFNYNDYAVKEKFEKIYFLFAREEVAKNSLGEYSDSLPKLKIKGVQPAALKLQQQTIDEEFLEYLDGVREKLAKAFKKNDLNLTSDELTEATQRTIDRLVFIRFLEDKLIEDDDYVSKLGLSKNSWTDFISICKALNAKYNGIVFKEHFIDSQKFSGPELSGFADICLDFSQRNPNGYNYNLIPIHILGSIYERFLGKVVVATDKRVRIDEKPEVRKAGGVYYTPKYIVDYIVQNTVGKLIENKSPKEISKLRFADIACGSGSFLIGVFETLLEYHNNYYWNHHDDAKADGCLFKEGAPVLSIRQKQNILLNNIYGVDIDHQAVEVTQLSLALKMLEDETLATANEMQVLFHEKILPDLTNNIVCGNSLIGTDILEGKMFQSEEERKLNPMDFEKRFPEIMKSGGFDAIVGNPPWGADFSEIELSYLRKSYADIIVRMIDSFMYFVYKSRTILKKSGFYGMILPDVI
ncbi:MAG TPA: DNA methyltransferase, partial [Ignavibacteria bacterium]|nr:DNA methyltransferase [Ignavibacteria bacterium]